MEFFPLPSLASGVQLQGATLVVPAVAQGNVGELAMDVLICSLGASLVGYLEDDNVLPCIGNDPFDMASPGTLTTALELFSVPLGAAGPSGHAGVFLLQQRAPAMPGRQSEFAENLVEWAQSCGAAQLVVLSGLDATLRKDRQLLGPMTRYAAGSAPHLATAAESQGITQLEEEYLADEREAHGLLPPWPLLAAAARRGVPHLLLGCFAAEGDNVPHAMTVAQSLLSVLGMALPGSGPAGAAALGAVDVGGFGVGGGPVHGVPGAGASGLRLPCSFMALYGRGRAADEFLG